MKKSNVTFQQLINSKKPKYILLDELFKDIGKKYEQVQIFIDLDVLLSQYFNPLISDPKEFDLEFSNNQPLVGDILSTVTYLRHYFASRHAMFSRFIFFTGSEVERNVFEVEDSYKKAYYHKRGMRQGDDHKYTLPFEETERRFTRIKDNLLKVAKALCKFCPSVYLLDSGSTNPDVIPKLVIEHFKETSEATTNLIIGESTSLYQYLCLPHTSVLHMKGENSKLVTADNFYERFSKNEKTLSVLSKTSNLLPDLNFLGGCTRYSVVGVNSKFRTVYTSKKLNTTSIEDILATLTDEEKSKYYENVKLLDVFKHLPDVERFSITSQLESFVDHSGLRKFLETKCQKYAINQDWLYEGEI